MPLKHLHKRSQRPDFVNGGTPARDLRTEESDNGCAIRLTPTFASVVAAMGSGLAVTAVLTAGAALALLESRGASDPFFLALAVTTAVAWTRFAWLHMSREVIRLEKGFLKHARTLLGLGPRRRYPAGGISNLRLDRPTGGVVTFDCRGHIARIGFGLNTGVSRRLLAVLETQLARAAVRADKELPAAD